MAITKHGRPITTLEEWQALAPPKRRNQWKGARSAKECARAWLTDLTQQLPAEIQALLATHADFGPVEQWSAEPEARLAFDDFPGEPRNTDLLVVANDVHGEFLMAVEAKADEPFGETIAEALANSLDRKLGNRRSNGMDRIVRLTVSLLCEKGDALPSLRVLRYQLLTATAGAVAEGLRRNVRRVVLLVHEFVTPATDDARHAINAADLNAFVTRLSGGAVRSVTAGSLVGPLAIPGAPLFKDGVALYIGKATRRLR